MLWTDLPNNTKLKLKQDTFTLAEIPEEFQYGVISQSDVNEFVIKVNSVGDVYTFDKDCELVWLGETEMDVTLSEPVDLTLYEII